MAAPTRVLGGATVLNNANNSKTSTAFDVVAGDLLIVIAGAEGNPESYSTPTATGGSITWTLVVSRIVANYGDIALWKGEVGATATGITVTVPTTGGLMYGFIWELFRDHGGVGVSGVSNGTTGAPSVALNMSTDSAVVSGSTDWNAQSGTITWRSVNGAAMTAQSTVQVNSRYSAYYGYRLDTGASGSETMGTSAPTGQKWNIVAVEILAGTTGVTLSPTGIASDEAVGSPSMTGNINLSPTGIASAEAVGTPTELGNINLSPTGIASAEAVGSPTTTNILTSIPTGIASGEQFGNPTELGNINLSPSSIATQEAFGSPTATITTPNILIAVGIASAEAFGTPAMLGTVVYGPTGILTQEGVGTPTHLGAIVLVTESITSLEVFGIPFVMSDEIYGPTGIASTEAFGIPFVDQGSWFLPRDPMDYSVADLEYEYYSRLSGLPLWHSINDHKYYFYKAYLGGIEGELDDLEYGYFKAKSGLVGDYSTADHKQAVFETATGGVYLNDDGKTYYAQFFSQGA